MAESRHEVFSRLFSGSSAALKRYVGRLVRSRDTAEEIVQEAFLRTFARAEEGRPPGALLYAIAHNLAVDHHRRERAAQTELRSRPWEGSVVAGAESESLEAWLLAEECASVLRKAIDRLPPQCRAAFALKVFHGCSYREVAERLAISEKTVEAHISRGIRETYHYVRRRFQLKDVGA